MNHAPAFLFALGVLPGILGLPGLALGQESARPTPRPFGAFAFQESVEVPIPPDQAYDRFVDVNAWWDHRFSESPLAFYLEAWPGGGFYEIFDERGDGVLHATVIFAARGRSLRLRGPLGLSGYALDMVFSLEFEAVEGGTRVRLDARGSGELEDGWAGTVQDVWRHFLRDRYKPWAEGTLD